MIKTSPILLATALALVHHPALASSKDLDLLNDDLSVVLTPTRLRQSLADVPGSVTVLTADMLAKFGVRSIPEALRLVPGMLVTQVSGNDYRINYHGTNFNEPRRMNVLIDGMSVYRSAFALVDWTALPVAVEDIQRIEVTRGPNSASYGPNSMLAIINIITKHPQAVEGATATATVGTRGTAEGMLRYSGKFGDSTNYRVTVEHQQNQGFQKVTSANASQIEDHDRSHIERMNFRSVTELTNSDSLDLQFALLSGKQDQVVTDNSQRSNYQDLKLKEYDFNAVWRRAISANHELKIQGYLSQHRNDQPWSPCVPTFTLLPELGALWRSNPNYVRTIVAGGTPSGGTATDNALAIAASRAIRALGPRALALTCGTANQDYRERRIDFEVQDTYVFSNSLRMVGGFGVRRDLADSESFLHGIVGNTAWRTFANVEYKPTTTVSTNIGGYYEKDDLTGSSFSPRLALNKRIDDNNTVRFVASRANRMPNIFEQRANWSYRVVNLNPALNGSTEATFAQSAIAPGNLDAEKILSKEIGYTGNFPHHGLMLDVKVFDDKLSNLISDPFSLAYFSPANRGDIQLRGAELQADIGPSDGWLMHFGYAYLKNHAASPLERTHYAKHNGTLAVAYPLPGGWRGSLAVYAGSGTSEGQSAFGKQDLNFWKTFHIGPDTSITPTFTVAHLSHETVKYLYNVGSSIENSYGRSMQYFLSVKLAY